MVSGAKEDAEKVFCPGFCVLRGSDSGGGGGGALVLLLPVNRVRKTMFLPLENAQKVKKIAPAAGLDLV